ncbi:Transporter, Drug/Metabolite Exporter family [Fusobacterium vincentii ATCC 49256]|uniref:Transporter, Drug/Metabolite Exporter family n=1 Tax=Fusobacterium vincentii ATCC 49256 TaxID=209882 RepID=Q7P273_FUSVC|nr:Transporter, Drug/Metabolite Exporter family [Fusobacterium vincentii ATCC 49256]
MFISFKDFKNFEFSLNFGDILTILCALGFALNILLFSKIKKFNINIINITIMQMLTIGILAFIFQIIFEKKVINFSMNFSLIYLILICTMLNFTIQNISQKYVPAHIMGLILSLEAIFGTVFAIIFLKETISQNFIIGTFLIAIAVILIQYFENKRGD